MANLKDVVKQIQQDDEPRTVTICDRTGKPYRAADGTDATLTLVGSESPGYRKRRDDAYRALAELKDEPTPGEVQIAVAACAVVDWHGWEDGKKALPCTPENVRTLLSLEHILRQVEAAVTRRADFFAVGSTD